jgi:hypothetical protein
MKQHEQRNREMYPSMFGSQLPKTKMLCTDDNKKLESVPRSSKSCIKIQVKVKHICFVAWTSLTLSLGFYMRRVYIY